MGLSSARRLSFQFILAVGLVPHCANAESPLHVRIDSLIAAKGIGQAQAPQADDAEFMRRVG